MKTEIDKIFDFLGAVNLSPAIREISELEAIKEWAIDSLGLDYAPGDRVRICSEVPWETADERNSGWYPYRYSLTRGREGIAGDIKFSAYHKKWGLNVGLDRCMSITDPPFNDKHWYGPEEDTPDGFEFIREEIHWFHMNVHWVQKAR